MIIPFIIPDKETMIYNPKYTRWLLALDSYGILAETNQGF